MRRTRTLFLLGLAVAGLSLAVAAGPAAAAKSAQPVGIEPVGSTEWPAVAAQLAKNIARDSFAHDYAGVWKYLLPAYQSAVSQSRWNSCQRSHPAAPPSVKITKVAVGSAQEVALDLSLVGRKNVQEIELLVEYTSPGVKQPKYAVVYTFWLKQANIWRAVWLGDEYKAYTSNTCYVAPQGSTIY